MIAVQIPILHIEQVNERYCGPAAAQMVLAANGLEIESQAALFDRWCHGQGDIGWASSPLGISRTLTRRMPDRASHYQIATTDTEEALSRKICWALFMGSVAVVLVNRIDHWIVVSGCGVSSPPTSAHDASYSIDYFQLHDPAVRRAEQSQNRQLLQVIPYEEWRRTYLRYAVSPALVSNLEYQSKFISITDAEPGGEFDPPDLNEEPGETRTAEQAKNDAIAALRTEASLQTEPWKRMGDSLIARRPVWTYGALGDTNGVYHVPFCRKSDAGFASETPVIVRIGETSGGPRGTILVPNSGNHRLNHELEVPLIVSVGGWRGDFRGAIACPDGGIDLISVAPKERWEAAGIL